MDHSHNFLRRANKPQKCFVSGETESVANTSAFVGPVALISAASKHSNALLLKTRGRLKPGLHALGAENHFLT